MTRYLRAAGLCAVVVGWSVAAAAGQAGSDTPPAQAPVVKTTDRDAACKSCHNASWVTPLLTVYQSRHGNRADSRTPGCQDCHGQSTAHIADPGAAPEVVFTAKRKAISSADDRAAACLACHESSVLTRTNWSGSQHQMRGLACNDCHNIHTPEQKVLNRATQAEVCFTCHKAQRAQVRRLSAHPLVGTAGTTPKMVCADCHNPHGSTGPTLLVKNSVNEVCYQCHAEKRGPFLWEHSPVVDSCVNCHTPHGSTNLALLKTRAPCLCQDCHSGDHGNQVNSGANLAAGNVTTVNGMQQPGAAAPRAQAGARACLNCHVLIHGSNHPAGAKFQR